MNRFKRKPTTSQPRGPFKFTYSFKSKINGKHDSGSGTVTAFNSIYALDLVKAEIGKKLGVNPKLIGQNDNIELVEFRKS
ncbi:hypothetical protein PUN47_20945 [Vibrio fluvialis]|uniref:hypothetical protein n=1 Tax=Vibrio fluvialis TaxID=676 RepID=UPI002380A76D|nr:hypothetical protein [Vibrio fluvialis]WDY54320.1 hypothetical protein PUN47_20945 [Vibrio fluvialis]